MSFNRGWWFANGADQSPGQLQSMVMNNVEGAIAFLPNAATERCAMASQSDFDRMKAIVDGVDHLARCMEKKWGVGQLRLLVDDDLRCRFDRQHEKWGNACILYELDDIQRHGDAMRRAWEALDKAATQAGTPVMEPDCWETRLDDGTVLLVCQDDAEALHAARAKKDEREIEVWSLAEVGRFISNQREVWDVKKVFPGATVKSLRSTQTINAPILFG